MKDKLAAAFFILAILALGWVLVCYGPSACTDEPGARRTLEGAGYRDITITGYRFFMKGDDDWYCTGFEAIGPSGQRVTGAVTGGFWTKGKTIRMD